MYAVLKNGKRFAEYKDFGAACTAARKDAYINRLSLYTIWGKETTDKPLYQITGGVVYTIPNPPNRK